VCTCVRVCCVHLCACVRVHVLAFVVWPLADSDCSLGSFFLWFVFSPLGFLRKRLVEPGVCGVRGQRDHWHRLCAYDARCPRVHPPTATRLRQLSFLFPLSVWGCSPLRCFLSAPFGGLRIRLSFRMLGQILWRPRHWAPTVAQARGAMYGGPDTGRHTRLSIGCCLLFQGGGRCD